MPFSPATIDFLVENRRQNSKTWFAERKADYTQFVLEPLQKLELVFNLRLSKEKSMEMGNFHYVLGGTGSYFVVF